MLMKYKDFKIMDENSMKEIVGGSADPGPCNVPADCGPNNCGVPEYNNDGLTHWDCSFAKQCVYRICS